MSNRSPGRLVARSIVVGTLLATALVVAAPAGAVPPPAGLIAFTFDNGNGYHHVQVIRTVDPTTGHQAWAADGSEPAWSPDGTRLAFLRRGGDGVPKIAIKNADGSLTYTGIVDVFPMSWSPNGRQIAFGDDNDSTDPGVWIFNTSKPWHLHRITAAGVWRPVGVSWPPDGRRLVFDDQFGHLHLINADGTGEVAITSDPDRIDGSPAWSPDGTMIAFDGYSIVDPTVGVFICAPDGSNAHLIAPTITPDPLAWSPTSTQIVYTSQINFHIDLLVVNADGTNPHIVVTAPQGGFAMLPTWQNTP